MHLVEFYLVSHDHVTLAWVFLGGLGLGFLGAFDWESLLWVEESSRTEVDVDGPRILRDLRTLISPSDKMSTMTDFESPSIAV